MKRKAKSEISDSAAKALKLQTRFVIIKMPVRQVIHSYLSSFLYPASTGSCFMKARQRKEKNKKYLKERYEEESKCEKNKVWYGRAYIIYTDGETTYTKYSEIIRYPQQ